jgi:signal transduction histidine kinase
VHPDDTDKIRDATYAALASQSPLAIDHRIVLEDGSERLVHLQAELVLDPAGLPTKFIGTAQDITDRVRLEEQLRQSQKMQAIGQLSGGVAHDFNNLLTVINGHSEMLLSMHPGDAIREELVAIRDAGERAALLTRQLLLFSRKAVLDPREVDCNAVVRHTSQMLRRLIGENVRLTTVLAPALYRIKADPSQIELVIMNLSLNARDAMPRGGRLTIETRNAVFTDEDGTNHPDIKPGQFVELRVIDTGSGMTPQVRAHLFEPFFTTKGPGKGTGLGLATVYGIVQESEGFVTVTSELTLGTTFKVFFPALKSDLTAAPRASADRRRLNGHETVLLVEDEEGVRQIARTTMEHYGYTVLVANSGPEALRLMEGRSEPIDLLLTDVVMPGISGPQLSAAVLERCPRCKIIFMSGYNEDSVSLNKAGQTFLQKPFTLLMLAQKLREQLDQP